ncbi:Protein esc2 [Haplosporangium gracile]|nr:Protein esc2 [Haplosporangium gracile]
MSDSDDNKPVQKRPQPRPRAKRSKVVPTSASTSSPNSALLSPRTDNTSGTNGSSSSTLAHNYSERVEDDFFNRASVSFRQIHKIQESRVNEELTKQESELEILDLKIPSTTDVPPTLDLEDDLATTESTEAAAQKKAAAQETKRKREVSLTPPPELPTRRYPTHIPPLSRPTTAATTTVIDLDDDDFEKMNELDPELASIAAKLNTIASQQSMEGASPLSPSSLSQPFANSSLLQSQSSQPSQSSPSIPAAATVATSSHGSGGNGAIATGAVEPQRILERAFQVTVRSNNPFREMMTFYCNQKGINYSSTVFTYLGMRLMPSSTPAALDFPARVIIDAYNQDAYKYIKEQENLERSRKLAEMERQAAEAAAAAAHELQQQQGGDEGGEQHNDAGDASEDYIFIKLRGKDTADQKIRVKKTTTVHAILSHYKSIKQIPTSTAVKLEFDDEALDPTTVIGNTEVEDDDMLVVRVG